MCGSNWASYIPPTRHFTFLSLLLVKSRPTGGKTLNVEVKYSSYIKYGTFHFEYRGEIFLVYLRREMKSRGAPQGVCTTLNSNHTLFWRSSEWGVELFYCTRKYARFAPEPWICQIRHIGLPSVNFTPYQGWPCCSRWVHLTGEIYAIGDSR